MIKEITSKLVCPNCKDRLIQENNNYSCKKCSETYSYEDDILFLVTSKQQESLSDLIRLNEEDLPEYHDSDSQVYDKEMYVSSGYLKRFFSGINLNQNDNVLDLGCGRGHFSEYLIENTDANIISQDILKVSLLGNSNPQKILASADTIPFESDSFDMVLCVDVFEHLPPGMEKDVLKEVYRVLKPGGTFYLAFPGNNLPNVFGLRILNIFLSILRLFDKRIKLQSTKECPAHINMTYAHKINSKIKKAGFKGKLQVKTIKFMSIPQKYLFLAKIINIYPFNYIFNKELTGVLSK